MFRFPAMQVTRRVSGSTATTGATNVWHRLVPSHRRRRRRRDPPCPDARGMQRRHPNAPRRRVDAVRPDGDGVQHSAPQKESVPPPNCNGCNNCPPGYQYGTWWEEYTDTNPPTWAEFTGDYVIQVVNGVSEHLTCGTWTEDTVCSPKSYANCPPQSPWSSQMAVAGFQDLKDAFAVSEPIANAVVVVQSLSAKKGWNVISTLMTAPLPPSESRPIITGTFTLRYSRTDPRFNPRSTSSLRVRPASRRAFLPIRLQTAIVPPAWPSTGGATSSGLST